VIASVRGEVASVGPEGAVVEVGGVGIAVHCTPGTLAGLRVGTSARLATSLVVREDSLTLYGFGSDDERTLFELLQTASGVGPRLALAVLAVHAPDAIRLAIASADTAALTRVPGIGKKGAERLVLELRDKIGAISSVATAALTPVTGWQAQVGEGLVGLGWTPKEAEDAVAAVAAESGPGQVDVPKALRRAIQMLGRSR
jgi:Holliday junction DNA helicase RuvA